MAYYHCKSCELRWQGDPWCEGCGKVSKPDFNHYKSPNRESAMPKEKWTEKSFSDAMKYSRIRRDQNKNR